MYTKPVGIKHHNIDYHYYVDNTQMRMVLMPEEDWNDILATIK